MNSQSKYPPGGDAKAISKVAKNHFGGSYKTMFERHGWVLNEGQQHMHQAQSQIKETYGSIREFEIYFQALWPDDISVLLTSFWGWTPETWGTVGWSDQPGLTHRHNLLKELSDPFICVIYVTDRAKADPDLKGMLSGFYLVSHVTGDRDEFSHPMHHNTEPSSWQHSLRALRAFSFLPEYRLKAIDVFPELNRTGTARSVSRWGKIIEELSEINQLRSTPWIEVPVFSPGKMDAEPVNPDIKIEGMVPAGPASASGYTVLEGTKHLPRELYILRLTGDTAAYMGRPVDDSEIFKIGLSVSPELRRQFLQKSMPKGAFQWQIEKTTRKDGHTPYSFTAAVAGENAMKKHLSQNAEHLGGEFYLASEKQIATAWIAAHEAAKNFTDKEPDNTDS
ncbi:MAG: hypothetical protein GDA55_07465 [Cellvibrionales bacterium]|nr:hypothetical protein [Cellvibrionales bacterium]